MFAVLQCLVTTGVATLIATASGSVEPLRPARLFSAWMIAWLVLVPVVILLAPVLDWLLSRVVAQETSRNSTEHDRRVDKATTQTNR